MSSDASDGVVRPTLTILTPTLNPAVESLERTFGSIDAALGQGMTIEHILIDGGSSRAVVSRIEDRQWATLISDEHANISESLTLGWEAASGSFVLVLNAGDVLADGLGGAIHDLSAIDASVGVFPVRRDSGQVVVPRWRGSVLRSRWIHAGMIVRTEVLTASGGYDRRFQFAMDWEWLSRASKRGISISFFPEAAAIVEMEPFGLSRQRSMSSAGEFLDVVRRDCPSRVGRLYVALRYLPHWMKSFLG